MEILINVLRVLLVIGTLIYGFKTMKEVNTDYQNYFGLGITLLFSALLSLFVGKWIDTINTCMWCISIYFFLQILKEKKLKT